MQIKDLAAGKEAAAAITDNAEWKAERPGQFEVAGADLVAAHRASCRRKLAVEPE